MSRLSWLKFLFLRYYRDMGLRVFLYALLSLVATLISPLAHAYLGERMETRIEFSSVVSVLTILASSMLAVSTFSLSIMVSAHRAAAEAATPRVHRILLENTTTQSVLAAFIGAFVYSLGSIVLYRLGLYAEEAALVVMAITTLVVVIVVISLLRWIQHLTDLGSVEDSLRSARDRARASLLASAKHPRFGASPLSDEIAPPDVATPFVAPRSGFLQLIDMGALQRCLPKTSAIYIDVAPGSHVLEGETIAEVSGAVGDDDLKRIGDAFTFGDQRTHEQDAEFGLIVLSEIAAKALSPGVNDPGTAIDSLLIQKSLLWEYALQDVDEDAPAAPSVYARFPQSADFVSAAFAPIAREGAGKFDVALSLRRALSALSASRRDEMAAAARDFAEVALTYAKEAGLSPRDLEQLQAVVFPATD